MKQHILELLSDKIPSCFISVIENKVNCKNKQVIWECLLNECNQKRLCILITSGSYEYSDKVKFSQKITLVHTYDYKSSNDLLNYLNSIVEQNNETIYIFIESLSWFFLDCPIEFEFERWAQLIITSLFNLALHSNVQRLVCSFRPLINKCEEMSSSSINVIDILLKCSTSILKCGSSHIHFNLNVKKSRVLQSVELWHRRSVQGEFCKKTDDLFLFNKPSFFECGSIELDPIDLKLVSFRPASKTNASSVVYEAIPKSTFTLHLSDSEKLARSQVVFPYAAACSTVECESAVNTDDLTIFYQPDCFDDLDDEDPDDVLDF